MKTIYKYPVEGKDRFSSNMPEGAQILSVQVQNDTPCLWALVDPEKPVKPFFFRLIGTGRNVDDCEPMQFIGTFQLYDGDLVFHLFLLPDHIPDAGEKIEEEGNG